MKRIAYISAFVLALSACTVEPFNEENGTKVTIEASIAENNLTKTIIQEGTGVYWEQGDEIKLFFDGIGSRLSSTISEPAAVSSFSGTFNGILGFNEGFSNSTPLWGLYPYRADATADNESVTTTLPSEQTGRAGSFAKGTFITLAKSQSLKMGFYNVCGGVRFSLVNDNIKEVVFEGMNGENLAGKVKLIFDDGYPVVSKVESGENAITLTAPGGGCFEKEKWYYIVALPGTLSGGFKMTFNTADKYAVRSSSKPVTIKRGVFGSLDDVDQGLIFIQKGTDPAGDNIVFKDPAAKFACIAKYDTNGDGEVSIVEAEAATSFSGLFTYWKGVTSFDEIVYFKNVHSISGVFKDCDKLVSMNLPENITDLGTDAFYGCKSLISIGLPSGITEIGNNTFRNCSKLASVAIPSGVTSIGSGAFDGTEMWKLELPSTVVSLGSYCFGRGIACVILLSTSPVSIQADTFDGVMGIFVPSNLVEMYKSRTYWTNSSYKLHPLSLYKSKEELLSLCNLATSGAVDMGTSVKWSAYNVGANKPEEYGDYYAWGETEPKSYYDWSSYFDSIDGSSSNFKKYYNGGSGKTVLDPEDDVAHVKWGGDWRMPTAAELTELIESCYWEWTTYKGISGMMVYGFTDNKIFLPAAGYRDSVFIDFGNVGSGGDYWSSSLYTGYPDCAFDLYFNSYNVLPCGYGRYYGVSVRPVSE